MAEGKPDFQAQLRALQEAFAKDLPKRLGDLEDAWLVGEDVGARLEAVRRQAHGLAGSGGTFGFPELSQSARALERRIQALQQESVPLSASLEADIGREVLAIKTGALPAPIEITTALVPRPIAPGGQVRILSTDKAFCEEILPQLQAFGFEVEFFDAFDPFRAALDKDATALVLVDLEDPGEQPVDLPALANAGRARGVPLPLVVISDKGDLPSRLEAVRAGARAYLSKPIDIFGLLDRLDLVNPILQQDPIHVLIIEDDPVLAQNHALVLRSGGIESTVVNDPLQVLHHLVDRPLDLILMDLNMPGCSGLELAAIIRQQDAFVGVPIVFLSGELRADHHMAAMRLGADDFLTKPASPDYLISVVVSRAQRGRRLRSFMVRDSLTGLLNHSAIKEQLGREFARSERLQDSLCFAMVDLDHFKRVNDTHGHPGGDRVLRSLARMIQHRLRKTDIVGRYGGEEFAIILPHTQSGSALQVMDNLRVSFQDLQFPFPREPTRFTLSCGLAAFPGFGSPAELTEAADQALYRAKAAGRNRVVLANQE